MNTAFNPLWLVALIVWFDKAESRQMVAQSIYNLAKVNSFTRFCTALLVKQMRGILTR